MQAARTVVGHDGNDGGTLQELASAGPGPPDRVDANEAGPAVDRVGGKVARPAAATVASVLCGGLKAVRTGDGVRDAHGHGRGCVVAGAGVNAGGTPEELPAVDERIAGGNTMNMDNEERFHELMHKALAKEAQAAERAELEALIAEHPDLKEEFEKLGAENRRSAGNRFRCWKTSNMPQGTIPPPPVARLRQVVREVFEPRKESPGELRELLARPGTVGEPTGGVGAGAPEEELHHGAA